MTSSAAAKSLILGLTSLIVSLSAPAFAERAARAKTTTTSAHNLVIYTLDNGLEVVLRQDRSFPRVAVSVTYFVGQRDQPRGYRGLAHLTEHLMYQGSKNVGEDQYFVHLERAGGTDRNAQTGPDDTTYYQAVPSNHLPTVLWLESDRMAYMLQHLNQTTLDQQRSVVIRELREDESHSPMSGLAEVIRRFIYPASHPYRREGDLVADVRRIRLEHIQWFFQRWYAPHNARLAVVGDFDVQEARAQIERYFGPIRASAPRPQRRQIKGTTRLDAERVITYGARTPRRQVHIVWPTPPFLTPGDAELDYVSYLLGRGRLSRLHRRLVAETGMAVGVFARQHSWELESQFTIHAEAAPEGRLENILAVIDEEVEQLCSTPMWPQEYERIEYMNRARELLYSENPANHAVRLSRVRSPMSDDGIYRQEQDMARYSAVTPGSVRESVCRYLSPQRRLVVLVVPDAGAPSQGRILGNEVRR